MTAASTEAEPAYTEALLRHFADLRDGTHGGASSRTDKERLFTEAVGLLDPYARQILDEINRYLLLDTGEGSATGIRPAPAGGVDALGAPSGPDPQARRRQPPRL